jgi:phosphoribosyl-ATP pyrophosphohydrolase
MLTIERLLSFEKDDLQEAAKTISGDELQQLVDWLSEKDDTIRYHSFLLLQHRSGNFEDVYSYWNIFCEKLKSENSYQRSIGLMLIAANAKWDMENRLDDVIDEYLSLIYDEKPITVRQCIQSLCEIVPYKKHLLMKIADKLMSLNITEIRATMQKLILTDILTILAMIRKYKTSNEIESYILNALSGGVLDKKAVKKVELTLINNTNS